MRTVWPSSELCNEHTTRSRGKLPVYFAKVRDGNGGALGFGPGGLSPPSHVQVCPTLPALQALILSCFWLPTISDEALGVLAVAALPEHA